MKVFFIEPYPIEGPSSRYRVEQYIPYLLAQGIDCEVRPFVSSKFYRVLYKSGNFLKKMLFFVWSTFKRVIDIPAALRSDVIFIHLEAYPLGPPLLEYLFYFCKKKIIYDLDDAIYLGKTSPSNKCIRILKCPIKIPHIIKLATHVVTCNSYLADYATRFNNNVTVIHTSLNTDKFCPVEYKKKQDKLIVGWIGSHSTAGFLEPLKKVFTVLAEKHSFIFKIIGAGKCHFQVPGVDVIQLDWKLEEEVAQFQSLDIGVYPLPDEEWVLGKTGFKTIQFMSVGIPCVASSIGTNKQIIKNGINGFLASTKEEWIEKLSLLLENPELRKRIGFAGRETIMNNYSLKVSAPKLLKIIYKI